MSEKKKGKKKEKRKKTAAKGTRPIRFDSIRLADDQMTDHAVGTANSMQGDQRDSTELLAPLVGT